MKIQRTGILLNPDCSRVLLRAFDPPSDERVLRILNRILSLPEISVQSLLDEVLAAFEGRHHKFGAFLLARYAHVRHHLLEQDLSLSASRKLLIGAYFTQEYALESAALFNPSMVWSPDQSGLETNTRRFVLSLRATGEGHISSICFRSGLISTENEIVMEEPGRFVAAGEIRHDAAYDRHLFTRKLREIGISTRMVDDVMGGVGDSFTMRELEDQLTVISQDYRPEVSRARSFDRAREHILSLAQTNYEVSFNPDQRISERILFPTAPTERNGMEDARFVRFEDGGSVSYYGTYTAYNGATTVPQMIETTDFLRFNISTLNGPEVRNKGMALFPRKINGMYAMLSRQDNENTYLMLSEHPHFWSRKELIVAPLEPWEYVQVGNCGSPIETNRGWLVLSHGVGPMRRYAISAFLLALDDPRKVIGRMHEPLLVAEGKEREGYVPNVVYSCGAVVNGDSLILPYAVSDYATSFAVAALGDILDSMQC